MYKVMLIARNRVVVVANVSFRTDDETKAQAAELFRDLGLDMSSAINMFLRQSIASNGIPFTPHRGNSASAVARAEVESRTGASFGSVAELMADLNEAD
ncbi:type II toxin-antitoxin system RelB/DinJ family antitoxin [Actinotignum sp. GS-2025a]|uniref:type II toxin-antitoxin system RelB/DinJ family antitoxin n=1 Tax=Actinotignum sp. GS-2025a TaxID=3427274 RepID=UPI003F461B54